MSISGIASSNWFGNASNQSVQNKFQEFQQDFQQLGTDLQAGNLSAAQQGFATLQQVNPQGNANASAQSNNPIAQEFSQLSQALQAGNLSAAQQDYSQIQQGLQSHAAYGHHHGHHHAGGENGGNQISELFSELGQNLQSGNLSSAQQAYATLQQEFPQLDASSTGQSSAQSSQSSAGILSVIA
jgi:outer membrane protein assembly factor BamD (BamD/ComL family)